MLSRSNECKIIVNFLLFTNALSLGVHVLVPKFAMCLYQAYYFDFIIEIDNKLGPFKKEVLQKFNGSPEFLVSAVHERNAGCFGTKVSHRTVRLV